METRQIPSARAVECLLLLWLSGVVMLGLFSRLQHVFLLPYKNMAFLLVFALKT